MFRLVIAIIIFTVLVIDFAKADEVWLQVGAVSKHSNPVSSKTGTEYNERHKGIGVEYHTRNYYYSAGVFNNSVDRDMTYAVAAKQWDVLRRRNFSVRLLTGAGIYKYEGEYLDIHIRRVQYSTGNPTITEIITPSVKDTESKGIAPWVSVSMEYRLVGVNLSYLPGGLIEGVENDVVTLQFKLKLK